MIVMLSDTKCSVRFFPGVGKNSTLYSSHKEHVLKFCNNLKRMEYQEKKHGRKLRREVMPDLSFSWQIIFGIKTDK
jgi:hypothetical protein